MAELQQERHVAYVDGTVQNFVITNTMISASIPTELPHLYVFVFTIVDPLDPKKDTLTRVAQLADLTTLPLGRDAALALIPQGTLFLSPTCTVTYNALDEAEAAADTFQSRCSALVTSWIDFNANFNAPTPTPAIIVLPTTDPSQLQALVNAYTTAKENRYDLGLAKTAADQALTAAQAAYTQAQGDVTALTPLLTTQALLVVEATNSLNFLTTLQGAGTAFLTAASCADAGDKTTFQNALNLGANQMVLLAGYSTDHSNAAAALTNFASTLTARLTAAQAALTTAQATDITAAQQYVSAQATEAAALAAVLAVCPDFQSTSVCTVAG
jgi:hypothetical protein